MGRPFGDITLYAPTPYLNNTPEYLEESSLQNFICDLYVQKMRGYKPPNATRVTIQPAYVNDWDHTWKNGAIFAIAIEFLRDKYDGLDDMGRRRYVLDIVHEAMKRLGEEYHWDKTVFERAYQEIIDEQFRFRFDYPAKMARDRRKSAWIQIEKTDTVAALYAVIQQNGSTKQIKLLSKRNSYWYDGVYALAKHGKWLDRDKFGIYFKKGAIQIFYSLADDKVYTMENGKEVPAIDYQRYFGF